MKRTIFMLTGAVLILVAFEVRCLLAGGKIPVPDDAELKSANEFLEKKFHLNSPRSIDAKEKLLKLLFDELKLHEEDPAHTYAILIRISCVVAEFESFSRLRTSLQQLEDRFEQDPLIVKLSIVREISKKQPISKSNGVFEVLFLRTIKQAIESDRYDIAKEIAAFAAKGVKQSQKADSKFVEGLIENVARCESQYLSIGEDVRNLKEHSDDEKSALAVGKFRCFIQNNWDAGLPLLKASGDPVLAKLASKELQKPSTTDDERETADGWYAYREVNSGEAQEQSRRRALYWYRELLPDLDQPNRIAEVKKRVSNLESEIPIGPVPWGAVALFSFEKSNWKQKSDRWIVTDLSGNKINAEVVSAEITAGQAGKGMFIGPGGSAEIPSILGVGDPQSISIWVNSENFHDIKHGDFIVGDATLQAEELVKGKKGNDTLVSAGATGTGFRLGPDGANYIFGYSGKWWSLPTRDSIKFKTNTWYHLAGTFDGDNASFYLNGRLQCQQVLEYGYRSIFTGINIGKKLGGDAGPFEGKVDELALFRRTLSVDEVETLYRMGLAGKPFVK